MNKASKTHNPAPLTGPQAVDQRTIADMLREQVLQGVFAPGAKLPSTVEFAALWKISKSMAHRALSRIVKEGLLERRHGSCTYVRERPLTLNRIGIYYDSPHIWTDEERGFYRSLQGVLEKKLQKMGITVSVFVDRRPEWKQRLVLAELRNAIFSREIQGLIIPICNSVNFPALSKLPLPLSALTTAQGLASKVSFDEKKYFREAFSRLAEIGCRSAGLISSTQTEPDALGLSDENVFADDFLREAERHGVLTRKAWVRVPRKYVFNKVRFGYKEFHSLWSQREHPDAVIGFPDMVVRGVVTAALELDVHRAKDLTFCFHRNAHVDILCPFPALWIVSDEGKVADALINQVLRQHEGKSVSPVRLSFDFQKSQRLVALPA